VKQVSLTRIEMVQFRSFVQPTDLDLANTPGLKLISGDNQSEPSLGANGAGKSTIWDAVTWCISERSVKGLRTSDLISYDKDKTEVATTWDVNGEEFRIHRAGPPSRIYINGEQAEQIEVDRLLGLSRVRFLNSVIFGQSVPLFIDLPMPARGDLLDEVLGLELWLQAAAKAVTRAGERASELTELQRTIAHVKGQLEGLPDVLELVRFEREWELNRRNRVREVGASLRSTQSEMKDLNKTGEIEQVDVDTPKSNYEKQRDRVSAYERQIGASRSEKIRLERELRFFDDNDNCPTCGQEITEEFANEHKGHLSDEIEASTKSVSESLFKLETARRRLKGLEGIWQKAVNQAGVNRQTQAVLKERVVAKIQEVNNLTIQLNRIRQEVNPYTSQKTAAIENKKRLESELAEKEIEEQTMVSELAKLNYWRQGFRKVRLFCLDNVLQELTIETRNSLLALGLLDWQVSFKSASETKSGTVKLGVQVDVKPPQHKSSKFDILSGGEGQRARLAGSLGLASLVQRWAGVKYNFEVWDEATSWLSSEGVTNLLDTLSYRADRYKKSVWLCDHRALQSSSFAEIYQVVKDGSGSHIVKLM
jgi:DNA repair exonuclease SbcCD ATPase subunit